MVVAIDDRALRSRHIAVVEHAAIGDHAVAAGIAQRLPLLENVEPAGAGAALDLHAAEREQAPQHVDHLEHLHALVLVDEVELGRGVDLARRHRLVEVGFEPGIGQIVERLHALRAEPDEIGEAVAAAAGGAFDQVPEAILELRLQCGALGRRQIGHLVAQEPLQQALRRVMGS